jgi:hypothetical protein
MIETSTPYTGRTAAMRTSPWLASEDLEGLGEVEVTIETTFQHSNVTMQDGRKQPKLFSVKFVGKERKLVLNATNRKMIVSKFGGNCADWAGKKVMLYVKDGVKNPSGGTTKGIRIK